jgi:TfdA family taurine catabolism dioxygenase TauD
MGPPLRSRGWRPRVLSFAALMTTPAASSPVARGPAVWRGADQNAAEWIVSLDAEDCAELIRCAEALRGRRLDSIRRADFPLSRTTHKLADIAAVLERGSGFVLLRGLPAGGLPRDWLEIIYWGLGAHLGIGVSQSAAGDRLGQVYDRGGTPDKWRYYTRGGALEFHMDPVDVVGLLCLRTALSGGASRIVSAGEVHNVIRAERPDLLHVLYRGFHHSRRGHGEATPSARVPVFAQGSHGTECYFLPVTVRQAREEGHPLSALEEEAMAFVDDVANRPGVFLDMDFRVGDIQFLSNRTILHSRTDYVDHPEPERKRHLLRLWLMMPHWSRRPDAMNIHERIDQAGGGVRPQNA